MVMDMSGQKLLFAIIFDNHMCNGATPSLTNPFYLSF